MVGRAESWKELGLAEELQNKDSVWLKSPERGLRVMEDCPKTSNLPHYTGSTQDHITGHIRRFSERDSAFI